MKETTNTKKIKKMDEEEDIQKNNEEENLQNSYSDEDVSNEKLIHDLSQILGVIETSDRKKLGYDIKERILEDKIARRLNENHVSKQIPTPAETVPQKEKINITNVISMICTILMLFLTAGWFLYLYVSNKKGVFVQNIPGTIVDEFNYLNDAEYFGNRELLIDTRNEIVTMIKKIKSKKANSAGLNVRNKNRLLYGDPGSGKSYFVSILARDLNKVLKIERLKEKYKEKFDEFIISDEDLLMFEDEVLLVLVEPTDIMAGIVGASENNVKKLFSGIKKLAEKKVVVLFLDECDSYFRPVGKNNDQYQNSIRSQFLIDLQGVEKEDLKNYYIIGATNNKKGIDPAFQRRLGNALNFPNPNQESVRKVLLSMISPHIFIDENSVGFKNCVQCSYGMSYNDVTNVITNEIENSKLSNVPISIEVLANKFRMYKMDRGNVSSSTPKTKTKFYT